MARGSQAVGGLQHGRQVPGCGGDGHTEEVLPARHEASLVVPGHPFANGHGFRAQPIRARRSFGGLERGSRFGLIWSLSYSLRVSHILELRTEGRSYVQAEEAAKSHDLVKKQKRKRQRSEMPAAESGGAASLAGFRYLVHVEDSSSVNTSSMMFILNHLRAQYVWFPDPFHMIHNVGLNGLKEAGMYGAVLLSSAAMDAAWGPWHTEKWFRVVQDSVKEYIMHMQDNDPLIQAVLPRVCKDKNWDLHDIPNPQEAVLESLRGASFLRRKGDRAQVSRWFVWHKRIAAWMGESDPAWQAVEPNFIVDASAEWSLRLIPLVYAGLQLGYVKSTEGSKKVLEPLSAGEPAKDEEAAGAEPLRTVKEQQDRIRSKCKNNLHVATAPWSVFGLVRFLDIGPAKICDKLVFVT